MSQSVCDMMKASRGHHVAVGLQQVRRRALLCVRLGIGVSTLTSSCKLSSVCAFVWLVEDVGCGVADGVVVEVDAGGGLGPAARLLPQNPTCAADPRQASHPARLRRQQAQVLVFLFFISVFLLHFLITKMTKMVSAWLRHQ